MHKIARIPTMRSKQSDVKASIRCMCRFMEYFTMKAVKTYNLADAIYLQCIAYNWSSG